MRTRHWLFIATTPLWILINDVRADVQTPSQSQSIALAPTDFMNATLVFNKFNPSLGTLTGVSFTINGHIEGTSAFENTSSSTATIVTNLQVNIVVTHADGSSLIAITPVVSTSDNVTAFDGVKDFGGTSGKTYSSLAADNLGRYTSALASDLAYFNGPGTITLSVAALGSSNATGSGNLLSKFSSSASAASSLIYTYTPVVPEPTSLALTAVGGLVILAVRRKRVS